jgi:hypothetical protein
LANQQKVDARFTDRHERVVFARKMAVDDPSCVVVDGEFLPWVFDDESGVWISFNGRWSHGGPFQKERHEMKIEEDMRKSEVWSRIRAVVLERDGHSCVLCGVTKPSRLHVHHILKRRDGGTHHYDNLLTVCPRCHLKADRELYDPDWESSVDVDLDGVFD